ncbi:LCP family protein [Tissierella carlieri]|uniref:LCP family protein n=1 Tax=Tissierella carlieri TaxID=689904 RepID=UPI001C114DCC|nr:LCP family protein [Tissierella carlieri]MBU5312901.1 LCP family protein [Tissierella carlieri]
MKKKFVLSFILSFICFALVFTFLGEKIFLRKNSTVAVDDGDGEEPGSENAVEPKVDNEILFLMMGVDAEDVKKSKGTRTDTMMLFKVNFDTGDINLLSIPRDTRVLIKGKEDKINHAHAFGGPELTMRTLRDFLNIDIDYYVKVDYRAVMEIVDAIGGVEIDVPQRMKYDDTTPGIPPLHIDLKKGVQTLYGKEAHDFLRYRSGYKEGDIGRIKAQQMFMKELIKQALKPKNIIKIPKFIETYFDYVETNIPLKVITKGALSAKKINMENMTTNTIPGDGKRIAGVDYWIYNREETRTIVQEMFGDYLLSQ